MANILRRLKRIFCHYGANPQFILTSGTISAPQEFAELLIEEPLVKIEQREWANAERQIWSYNPPILNPDLGIQRHPFEEALQICFQAIKNWQEAARLGSLSAHLELAKYYAHLEKEPNQACKWVEIALKVLEEKKDRPFRAPEMGERVTISPRKAQTKDVFCFRLKGA